MNTAKFLKYVRPFFNIMHENVNWKTKPIFGENGFSDTVYVLEDYARFLEELLLDIWMQKFSSCIPIPDLKNGKACQLFLNLRIAFIQKRSSHSFS